MASVTNKRSVMTLYSGANDVYSHRARIVLAEKNVTYEVIQVDPGHLPEDLIDVNPYNSVPTLIDRDLVLYNSKVVMEYLDERFPHPPLMPVDPVSRARARLMLYRIDHDWYSLVADLEEGDPKAKAKAAEELKQSLTSIAPLFEANPFFLSADFSLIDCSIAPLLWRLKAWGIELPAQAKAVTAYAEQLFDRAAFQQALTDSEKAIMAG